MQSWGSESSNKVFAKSWLAKAALPSRSVLPRFHHLLLEPHHSASMAEAPIIYF